MRIWLIPALLVLLCCRIQSASGQDNLGESLLGEGGVGGLAARGGLFAIASNKVVQAELDLSSEATTKLSRLRDQFRAEMRDAYQLAGIKVPLISITNPNQVRPTTAEFGRQLGMQLNEKFTPQIQELFSPNQFKRLKQIQFQARAGRAMRDAEVATALKLSEEQRNQILDIHREIIGKQRQVRIEVSDRQLESAQMRELDSERESREAAVLTDEQRSVLADLRGLPFDGMQLAIGDANERK